MLPDISTIFGSVFLQVGQPGIASYHFELEDCYISYENAPVSWRLADGSSPPARKPFLSPAFDAETRTFTGTIEWGSENPFNGDSRWEYTMVFSETFNVICDGHLTTTKADGSAGRTHAFPADLKYWRELPSATSIVGQVYVQGGTVGLASYHFESLEDCYISYENAPDSWKLADGSSPPARKLFLSPAFDAETRTFTGTIEWGANTFGGHARWEYTMVFSETFDMIVSGAVRCFDPVGNEGRGTGFAPPSTSLRSLMSSQLNYEALNPARSELIALLQ